MEKLDEKLRKKEERKKKRKEKIKKVKEELKFDFNIPNLLTLSRIIIAFIFVYMLFAGFPRLSVAIVFAVAAFTDALDGWTARKFNQTSQLGGRLDQVVDRVFSAIIIFSLGAWFFKNSHIMQFDKNFILMLFLVSSREIIALPGLIIRMIRNKDFHEVRYVGRLTCWFQGFTIAFMIVGYSFSIYFAIATCFVGIIAGFDYLKRSFL